MDEGRVEMLAYGLGVALCVGADGAVTQARPDSAGRRVEPSSGAVPNQNHGGYVVPTAAKLE